MEVKDFEARLSRMEKVLTRVAEGDFDQRIDVGGGEEDAITNLELGINFMILDLRTMIEANQENERRLRDQARDLEEKLERIQRQEDAIRELSTPAIEVWDDVLALPIIGTLDSKRSAEIMDSLLGTITRMQTRNVVVDLTGVELVDTSTADHLIRIVRAAGLLGARCVLSGLRPEVARVMVELDADLGGAVTVRNLKEGLRHCIKRKPAAGGLAPTRILDGRNARRHGGKPLRAAMAESGRVGGLTLR